MSKTPPVLPRTAAEELTAYRGNMVTVRDNLQHIPTERARTVVDEASAAIVTIDHALAGDPSLSQVEDIYQTTVDVVTKATALVSAPEEAAK